MGNSAAAAARWRQLVSLASLRRTRALLAASRARPLAAGIAVAYMLLSMVLGQMLTFPTFSGPSLLTVQLTGSPWWDFPEIFVFHPGVALDLLLLPTATMVLVSLGVGIGAAAAWVTGVAAVRRGRAAASGGTASTSAAGASAAITGVATMGACCCTTCVGTAGVAVVAAASGADLATLLRESWYLNLFQLAVVGVALITQERSLRRASASCAAPPRIDRTFVAGAVIRVALMIAGITWSLAMFVEWTEVSPFAASAAQWYHWIFEHQALALAAMAGGMFPKELQAWILAVDRGAARWLWRGALLAAGVTWGAWVPPALTGLGLGGWVNELLGLLGTPVTWGAVAPDSPLGTALLFHWGFQHLLLATFAIALAWSPHTALAPLIRTVEPAAPSQPVVGPDGAVP